MADQKANTTQAANQVQKADQGFDLQNSMHKAEDFYTRNKNIINISLIAVVVVVGGIFSYNKFLKAPKELKAQKMIFQAQNYFAVDSFSKALNGVRGGEDGFLQVIDKYPGTKAGNIARYSAGVCYVKLGEYQKGIDMLNSFSSDDMIVQAVAYGITGDAYMELNKGAEAIDYYKKAAAYNPNELTSPMYLFRAGLASEKAGKSTEAIAFYKEVKEKYPTSTEGREIDKYLARLGVVR
ncbi:tetratricopeptide repeat protein [Chitinophaga skermanii]|uniref:Tetratricopeptide repeat protein n=1 Tax=Chitinophaga skermanii TaxID=331697 RepID=A0A327QTT0_9BACT|nr:tetratricopeptide repeat protein [Chitinophaga skermanii]RAJ06803.1 tetratricopeptide repeat protein [Chitinophaga skermanii]